MTVHAKKIIYLFNFKNLCAIDLFSLVQQIETYSVNQQYNSLSDTESCWCKLAQEFSLFFRINWLFRAKKIKKKKRKEQQ